MTFSIHTDGGARGNPGPAAIGVVVEQNGHIVHEISKYIGEQTNNVAEYRAVAAALEWLCGLTAPPTQVSFYLDSLLVVQQLNGVYKIKNTALRGLQQTIETFQRTLPFPVTYAHVRREQNSRADFLVNQALDARVS